MKLQWWEKWWYWLYGLVSVWKSGRSEFIGSKAGNLGRREDANVPRWGTNQRIPEKTKAKNWKCCPVSLSIVMNSDSQLSKLWLMSQMSQNWFCHCCCLWHCLFWPGFVSSSLWTKVTSLKYIPCLPLPDQWGMMRAAGWWKLLVPGKRGNLAWTISLSLLILVDNHSKPSSNHHYH